MTGDPEKKERLLTVPHPLEALSLLALSGALILFIISILKIFEIQYGVDFGEGYLANMSQEMVRGHNPYHSLDHPPWIVSSYPPLFPLINGLIMALLGPSLLPGRFIAAVSLIGILATSVLILRRLGIGATIAVLAAGIMLVFPWSVQWAQVVRVDTLGILLTLSGLYIWIRSDKPGDAVLAAVFLSLAVLTKHSLLAAPLAILVHAFITKDRRRIMLLALLPILIGGSYGIINLLTGGGLFDHLFTYTANAWFMKRFTSGLGEYFKVTWILQIIAISALLIPGIAAGHRKILGWYYLFTTLTLTAYGFEGSDTNYFIEPLLATALLAGLALDHFTESPEMKISSFRGIPSAQTIAYGLILTIFILGRFINASDYKIHRVTPDKLSNGQWLMRMAADVGGDVLSEDASFPFLVGKEVVFQPYIMSLLSRTGKWDQDEFVSTIRDGKYSMIILRVDLTDPYNTERRGGVFEMAGFDRWTEEMEDAIIERYRLQGGTDVGVGNHLWYVYFPRDLLENDSPTDNTLYFESIE